MTMAVWLKPHATLDSLHWLSGPLEADPETKDLTNRRAQTAASDRYPEVHVSLECKTTTLMHLT